MLHAWPGGVTELDCDLEPTLSKSSTVCSSVCQCVAFDALKPKLHACSCPVHALQVLGNAQTSVANTGLACGPTSPDLQTASTPMAIAALAAMGMGQVSTGRHAVRYSTFRKPSRCLLCASFCAQTYLCLHVKYPTEVQ